MAVQSKGTSRNKIIILGIAAVIICAVIVISVIAAVFSRTPQSPYDFGKETAVGIDISEHNGAIDWERLRDEVDFVFIRVGYRGYGNGKINIDKNARRNLENAEKSGIPFGAYFYSQATNEREAVEEAHYLCRQVRKYHPDLPLMLDFEYPVDENGNRTGRLNAAGLTSSDTTTIINAFCDAVRDKGYIAGVYCSSGVACNELLQKKLSRDTVLWVADYNSRVTYNVKYDIWQYSCTESLDCVESEFVDFNYWYKSRR